MRSSFCEQYVYKEKPIKRNRSQHEYQTASILIITMNIHLINSIITMLQEMKKLRSISSQIAIKIFINIIERII